MNFKNNSVNANKSSILLCGVCFLFLISVLNQVEAAQTNFETNELTTQALQQASISESAAIHTNPYLNDYKSTPGVYGTVTSVGSETLADLMTLWAQHFKKLYPHINFQIQAKGSATASQALTQGTANIGPMSRLLSAQEIAKFTQVHGYPPTTLVVAIDAVAIYVKKNNPLNQLRMQQLDSLFSSTRLCGGKNKIQNWSQVNVEVFGQSRQIKLYGKNSASGTYDLFKQKALCNGDYKQTINQMPSSSSVIQSVSSSIGGLGYASLAYQNSNVKTLALVNNNNTVFAPTANNVQTGKYPLTRFLYVIVNKKPKQRLATLERTFLKFILSKEGQAIVQGNGYYAVPSRLINEQLAQLDIQNYGVDAKP